MLKKLSYISIFLFVFIISCKKDKNKEEDNYTYTGELGDIVSILEQDTFTVAEIQSKLPAQISSFVNLKSTVYFYKVEYKTEDRNGNIIKASGLILVPKLDSFSLPLSSYQHGTILKRTDVPSFKKGSEYLLNLAISSEAGVVSCIPDYIGLGTGDGLHLYLQPTEEANSVRDILRCARKLVAQKNMAKLNGQVFLFGYSQGGHATMAAQRQLEKEYPKEFKLTASAPMAGPYALSRTSQFNVMLDSVYYPNPFYLPYLVVSLFNTFPNIYSSYSQLLKYPYDSLTPIIIDGYKSASFANSKFPNYISNIIVDSVKLAIKNNPNHPIRLACKAYDLVDDWTPRTPMKLYHCSGDDNVFYDNSVYADSVFKARGANIELVDLGSANHTNCGAPAFILCKVWFGSLYNLVKIK